MAVKRNPQKKGSTKGSKKGSRDFKSRLVVAIDLKEWDYESKWTNDAETVEFGMLTREGYQSYGVKVFRMGLNALADGETDFCVEMANEKNPNTEEWGLQLVLNPFKEELPF